MPTLKYSVIGRGSRASRAGVGPKLRKALDNALKVFHHTVWLWVEREGGVWRWQGPRGVWPPEPVFKTVDDWTTQQVLERKGIIWASKLSTVE